MKLNAFRQLSAKALHPREVFLASLAPAAELEALVQLLLPLLQGVAEVVDPVVVRDLLTGLDRSLGNEEDLVAVDVQSEGVRLTAVVEQQKSWEYSSSNLPEDWTCSSFKDRIQRTSTRAGLTYFEASRDRTCWFSPLP